MSKKNRVEPKDNSFWKSGGERAYENNEEFPDDLDELEDFDFKKEQRKRRDWIPNL